MRLKILCLVCLLISYCNFIFGCNLADHKWRLNFALSYDLLAPLTLIPEIDLISDKYLKRKVDQIIWIVDNTNDALSGSLSQVFSAKWPKEIPWKIINKNDFQLSSCSKNTIILGSSNTKLKISLFTDKYSKGRCHELVISTESLVKIISVSSEVPFAEQYRLQSWLALSFIDIPSLGNFLSITAFPYDGRIKAIYENQKLAESLMDSGYLKRLDTAGAECAFE